MTRPSIHVLTGCTACGKTALALEWALANNAEILSCDSLLFYRGMDIGTAKPAVAELSAVRHHLVDIMDPSERMDVKRFVDLARAAVAGIESRGRKVLVVGGSGFYLRSFFRSVTDDVPVDQALRDSLGARLCTDGLTPLLRHLEALNPGGLGALDVRNARRVLRALERCLVSGLTLAELTRRFAAQDAPFADHDVEVVEIVRDRDELRERISARTVAMLSAGLIDEIRGLRAAGFEKNPSAAGAIGYREVIAWLDSGSTNRDELAASIVQSTCRLARKQRTWFRRQLPEHRVLVLTGDNVLDAARLFESQAGQRSGSSRP